MNNELANQIDSLIDTQAKQAAQLEAAWASLEQHLVMRLMQDDLLEHFMALGTAKIYINDLRPHLEQSFPNITAPALVKSFDNLTDRFVMQIKARKANYATKQAEKKAGITRSMESDRVVTKHAEPNLPPTTQTVDRRWAEDLEPEKGKRGRK